MDSSRFRRFVGVENDVVVGIYSTDGESEMKFGSYNMCITFVCVGEKVEGKGQSIIQFQRDQHGTPRATGEIAM